MLILKITDERETNKRIRGIFRKKILYENDNASKRYSINVNGKTATVFELCDKDLKKEEFLTLLKIYKGRVLAAEKEKRLEYLEEYLFNPKEYYQRAILSSLINQIKTVNKEWQRVFIKNNEFSPFKEFYQIVMLSKRVVFITERNALMEHFLNECYYEYGAIVTVKEYFDYDCFDVYIDLDQVDNNGKLMINVNGRDSLLYADMSYFENDSEYEKLLPFDIEYNIICAAFSDK